MSNHYPAIAAQLIKAAKPNFVPRLGIILGSGLGRFAESIEESVVISYSDLPGFPRSNVEGHAGKLHLGYLNGTPVACLQGRSHRYEGATYAAIKCMIRTLKLAGCQEVFITNAAGSLREDIGPGELVLLSDHINLSFDHPLVGPNDDEFGPRFVGMENAYDKDLRAQAKSQAEKLGIRLTEGVYLGVLGPTFETPAEIRAFRVLGADVVGMSTIPDVIIARHCGLKVITVSAVTNFAAGMSNIMLTHDVTLQNAKLVVDKLEQLLRAFAGSLHHG